MSTTILGLLDGFPVDPLQSTPMQPTKTVSCLNLDHGECDRFLGRSRTLPISVSKQVTKEMKISVGFSPVPTWPYEYHKPRIETYRRMHQVQSLFTMIVFQLDGNYKVCHSKSPPSRYQGLPRDQVQKLEIVLAKSVSLLYYNTHPTVGWASLDLQLTLETHRTAWFCQPSGPLFCQLLSPAVWNLAVEKYIQYHNMPVRRPSSFHQAAFSHGNFSMSMVKTTKLLALLSASYDVLLAEPLWSY